MIRFVVILFFFLSYNSLAQDVHFSQFNETKALINPALVGYQDGDYKIQAQRRSQWGSVTVPFNTFSIASRLATENSPSAATSYLQFSTINTSRWPLS